jgi:hypothetical protein
MKYRAGAHEMKAYRVEEMEGLTIVASHNADGRTPFEAAGKALGRRVTLRGSADKWIRVTEMTGNQPTRVPPGVFEYKLT